MRFPVSGLISFKELSETLGKETRTTVHRLGLILPPSEAAKELGTEADKRCGKSSDQDGLTENILFWTRITL